jgi:ubiquinone/menaquinone biosynthesis C-methylase UbiE
LLLTRSGFGSYQEIRQLGVFVVNRSLICGLAFTATWGFSAWGMLLCHDRVRFAFPNSNSELIGHQPQRSYLPHTIISEIDSLEPGAKILDVGTGFSLQALRYLKNKPQLRVTGIDEFDYYGKLHETLEMPGPPEVIFGEPDEEQSHLRDLNGLNGSRIVYSVGGIAPDVIHNWSQIFKLPLPTGCHAVIGAHLAMFCQDHALLDTEFYLFISKSLERVRLRQLTGGLAIIIGNAENELRDIPSNSVAVVTDIFGAFTRINQHGNPLSYLRQVHRILRPGGKAFLTMTPASYAASNYYDSNTFRTVPLVQILDQRSEAINIREDLWHILEIVKGDNLGFRRAMRHVAPYRVDGFIRFRNFREEQHARDRTRRDGGRRREGRTSDYDWE